jgi:hypothetical protein
MLRRHICFNLQPRYGIYLPILMHFMVRAERLDFKSSMILDADADCWQHARTESAKATG